MHLWNPLKIHQGLCLAKCEENAVPSLVLGTAMLQLDAEGAYFQLVTDSQCYNTLLPAVISKIMRGSSNKKKQRVIG